MTAITPPNSSANTAAITSALRERALALGFSVLRITHPAQVPDQADALQAWLGAHYHGTMAWMGENTDRRSHPARLWPEARSIIAVAHNYGPLSNPLDDLEEKSAGVISVYARRRDYHEVIKGRLKELAGFLASRAGCDVKVFVDTAPLMERPVAAAAGLGWQGKHTVLVSRDHGNWLLLGFIFATVELPADAAEIDHCGSCTRCLDICPTNAFPAPHQLDARRCIAYLTIEHQGQIDRELRPLIGNRIFGCDDCLAICPWNKFARASADMKLAERADLRGRSLAEYIALDDPAFRTLFAGTPVKRTGRDRFVRNVLVAMGNSADPACVPDVVAALDDPSPLVRGMAVWALQQLDPAQFKAQSYRALQERDDQVRSEWDAAASV
ncbi:MAG: tRNA epoxyqueuosine(34) reductase QueG [Beijerinckiaceae bacterium]